MVREFILQKHLNGLMGRRLMLFIPVLVEVQNTVDKPFIRRVIKYCGHLCDEYDVEPIVVILSIHPIPSRIPNTFTNTETASYMKILPSTHWAQAAYFLDLKTLHNIKSDNGNALPLLLILLLCSECPLPQHKHQSKRSMIFNNSPKA